MKKTLVAVSLAFIFTANASASVFNPTYLPKDGEAFLKSELRYQSSQTSTSDSGRSKLDIFGGTWGDSFDFGYGLSNKVTLRIARTPINDIYNLVSVYDSAPAIGVTYRVIDSGLKIDLLGDWGIALAKHTDEDYDNSSRIKTTEESNTFHAAAKIGSKGDSLSYAATIGALYITKRETEVTGAGVWDYLKSWDSKMDYYLKLAAYYDRGGKLNFGGKFVYSQLGEQDEVRTGSSAGTTTHYEDLDPHMYFEINGDYQLKENVNIQSFIGYSPETTGNSANLHNDFVNAGLRFGINF